jgi:hypothetical protein
MNGPNGVKRGEIGVHRDAGADGSLACLVFQNDSEFNNDYVPLMQKAAIAGIKEIPLEVDYL